MFDLGLQESTESKGATIPARVSFEPIKDKEGIYKGIITFEYNPDEDSRVRYINKKQADGTLVKTAEVNNSKKGICILVNDKLGQYQIRGTGNFTFSLNK